MLNKEREKKELIKNLKNADSYIAALVIGDSCGCGCCGDGVAIMGMLSTIAKQLHSNGVPKDMLLEAINVGLMNEEELKQYEEKQLKKLEKKLKEKFEDK